MTDAFEAQGEFAPVQSDEFAVSAVSRELESSPDSSNAAPVFEALDAVEPAEAPKPPNGFIKLGLAPELIAAVEDLGFTQPTTVQEQVIPRAMTASGQAD